MTARPPIDPADYLKALQPWDGTARLDRWLVHVLGETLDSLGALRHEYLCLVGRFWFLGMVYRAMEPGCPISFVPVLEGPGGLGKSSLLEALGGRELFCDAALQPGRTKDAAEQVQGFWLYEIAELGHFNNSERPWLQSFVLARSDALRPSYETAMQVRPRRCLFVATTTEEGLTARLMDDRRFWPVTVTRKLNTEFVRKFRDQLLAEAYCQWQQQMPCHPSEDQQSRIFSEALRADITRSVLYGQLVDVLSRPRGEHGTSQVVHRDADFLSMSQVVLALGVAPARSSANLESRVRDALQELGWQRVKRTVHGARLWGYARPEPAKALSLSPPPAGSPAPQSQTERSGPSDRSASPDAQTTLHRPGDLALPVPQQPRLLSRAQSLFRRFGFQLTWVPSGVRDGEVAPAILAISRAPAPQRATGEAP